MRTPPQEGGAFLFLVVATKPETPKKSTPTKRRASTTSTKKPVNKNNVGRRKTSRRTSSSRKRQHGFRQWLRSLLPGWPVWLGAAAAVIGFAFLYRTLSRTKLTYSLPQGYNIHGIDVSHYQGNIDWELLRNRATIDECPIQFVMMKATEGANIVDSKFANNFAKAHEYGFTCGAYHFYSTLSSAREQAAFFINKVELKPGDLPPVLDVEVKPKEQTKEAFKQNVLEWLSIVERHYGVKPILYTYYRFKLDYLNDSVFNQYPYWIAHYYVDSVAYQGSWKFWQHTDQGRLPGIKGKVDLNVYNGSFYDLRKMTIGGVVDEE